MATRFLITLLCGWSTAFAANPWSWLEHGPHAVGYRVVQQYDYGRNALPKYTFEGKLQPGERALPIQISIWYPARSGGQNTMTHQDYVTVGLGKENFVTPSPDQIRASRDGIKFIAQFGAGIELTEDEVDQAVSTKLSAVRNATASKGSFPVLIVGTDGGPQTNALLWEYLASHGYVVLLTPSISRDATRQASAPQLALADRINNLELLLSFARTLPNVDLSKLGVIGVNFDGMAAVLYQCKNGEADAVVSIDGWEGKSGGASTVQQSIFFNPNQFRSPYFVVEQHDQNMGPPLDLSDQVFDSFLYADRYSSVYRGMNHSYLIGNLYTLSTLDEEKKISYRALFESVCNFLDAYVKKEVAAMDRIEPNNSKIQLVKVVSKKGLPPIPSPAEFEGMIMAGEFDRLRDVVTKALDNNPKAIFTSPQQLDLFHFRYRQRNLLEAARQVREIGIQLYPLSVEAMWKLAEASTGDEVQTTYRRALLLVDRDTALSELERKDWKERIEKKLNELR